MTGNDRTPSSGEVGSRAGVSHRLAALVRGAVAILTLAACGGHPPDDSLPNIFLITSDTLRADHLSIGGYPRETSPALDDFARKSWRFTQAVTVIPKTGPSFATMFTGRHPEEHGVRSNFEAIPEKLPVLAERLKGLGYRTAAFVGNPVLRSSKGFARGFDHYEHFAEEGEDAVRSVNRAFLNWAGEGWERPSFVWLHYLDPHGPYTPPEELEKLFIDDAWAGSDERVSLKIKIRKGGGPNKMLGVLPVYHRHDGEDRVAVFVARYDAEIRYVDSAFAEVLSFLERKGLYEPSAIVFTSDHGESLGEHNYYFEHGWYAYEPTLHIPLMIKMPDQKEGRTVETLVSNLDLLPTFLAMVGQPPETGTRGVDLLSPIDERAPVLIENSDRYPEKYYGLRAPGWKYLVRSGDRAEELYDLGEDPGETHNLAQQESKRLAVMREAFARSLEAARSTALPPSQAGPDDPETLQRLKALGYVE